MRLCRWLFCAAGMFGSAGLVARTHAQCTTIDFDDLAVGTEVTTQYAGVTFSGRLPGGALSFEPIIYNANGSTTSEPLCLSAQGISNEFSDEFIRMVFDQDQSEVTFNMGVRIGCTANDTVQVRLYDVGGVLRRTMNVPVNGTLATEQVLVFVRAVRLDGGDFRRVEVEGSAAGGCALRFELIDDLSFDVDTTAPTADISTPAALACVCNSSAVIGTANDSDGGIASYRLERKAPDAGSWTLIAQSSTEVVNGQLATWTTAAPTGWYILRLTVTNLCGLTAQDTTVVWLDKSFDSVSLRLPAAGAILGGTMCVDGTVSDHCSGTLTVEHRPSPAGAWAAFDTIFPPWIATDPLGSWNTLVNTPDGSYDIRVTGADQCGNSTTSPTVTVTIDNTAPVAIIKEPDACTPVSGWVQIRGTVVDTNLSSWALYYTGSDADQWTPIPDGSGNTNVVDGLLAEWDTSALAPCCYTIRLVATDLAVLNCNDALHHQAEDLVSVDVGLQCQGDIDGDGDVDAQDLALLLAAFGQACP